MTEAAISKASQIKDWNWIYLGSGYNEDRELMMAMVEAQVPYDAAIGMETPIKLTGSLSVEIPKATIDGLTTDKSLSIWATIPNPRDSSDHLGVSCYLEDVTDKKSAKYLGNWKGASSLKDMTFSNMSIETDAAFIAKRAKFIKSREVFNVFEGTESIEIDKEQEMEILDYISSCDA